VNRRYNIDNTRRNNPAWNRCVLYSFTFVSETALSTNESSVKSLYLTVLSNRKGLSLIETAFVLLIVGVVLAMAAAGWHSTLEARRISAAGADLKAASNCLVKYVLHSDQIPPATYFSTSCRKRDPWGEPVIYFNAADNEAIAPGMASLALNANGINKNNIAWVLVSKGPNKTSECALTAGSVTCTGGDDLYYYVSVEKLYEQISKN